MSALWYLGLLALIPIWRYAHPAPKHRRPR